MTEPKRRTIGKMTDAERLAWTRARHPWSERDALFDAWAIETGDDEPRHLFAANYDAEFYGHERITACAVLAHDIHDPYVVLAAIHDEDYDDEWGEQPETLRIVDIPQRVRSMHVHSVEQARAVIEALHMAWPELRGEAKA